jgi:hypothetical protein
MEMVALFRGRHALGQMPGSGDHLEYPIALAHGLCLEKQDSAIRQLRRRI